MLCSDYLPPRRRLICHVVSARYPVRDVQREIPHKPNTLLPPVCGTVVTRQPASHGHILRQINAGNLFVRLCLLYPPVKA